ncbi:patatin-like phospholipase family protein, partial [Archangium sp.]|uniref:patatin-like phospholipase family protein n=1 Tax=Archangium sp. TaxID=1872627 RepID=UPI002ED81340
QFLEGAKLETLRGGETRELEGPLIALQGEFRLGEGQEELGCSRADGLLGLPVLFGSEERLSMRPPPRVRVRGPARFIRLEASRLLSLYERSAAFRRSLQEEGLLRRQVSSVAPSRPQVIRFESRLEGIPLAPLLEHLAARIQNDFQESVQTGLRFSGSGEAHYVFLTQEQIITSGPSPLEADTVVRLTDRLPRPTDWDEQGDGQTEHLDVVLLENVRQRASGELMLMHDAHATQREGGYSVCWVDLAREDLELLASGRPIASVGLTRERRINDALGRWARAVTHRRVGVALSGGGVWGFRHVAILRMLESLGVPIDMVSGASIGSVVAAYYCALGPDGLEALLELSRSRSLRVAQLASLVTPWLLQRMFQADLGRLPLQGFATRCLPVATSLSEGRSYLVFDGRVDQALAMCCSPPGLNASVPYRSGRFVDGAILNDLPASVLTTSGADFILAVNCYPLAKQGRGPDNPGRLQTFLEGLDPVRRFVDLWYSGNMMLYANSFELGSLAHVFINDDEGVDGTSELEEPLSQALDFSRAREILEMAMDDEMLRGQVERFAERWRHLPGSRGPSARARTFSGREEAAPGASPH